MAACYYCRIFLHCFILPAISPSHLSSTCCFWTFAPFPFHRVCSHVNEPNNTPKEHNTLTYDALRQRCRRGSAVEDSTSAQKTRPLTMGKLDRKREREAWEGPPNFARKRSRLEQIHLAYVMEKGTAKQHVQCRGPALKETPGASAGALLDGAYAASSRWTAGRCNTSRGTDPTASKMKYQAPPGPGGTGGGNGSAE